MKLTTQELWKIWEKADSCGKKGFRKDQCGAWMKFSEYGNRNSSFGWEVDHIKPVSQGGKDNISNLRPLQWRNNLIRSDGRLTCPVTSSGSRNKVREKKQYLDWGVTVDTYKSYLQVKGTSYDLSREDDSCMRIVGLAYTNLSVVNSKSSSSWEKFDFIKHYFSGEGSPVTLREIGHFDNIIKEAQYVFRKVEEQIIEKAKQNGEGDFEYKTKNSYDFRSIVYSVGGAVIKSTSQVTVKDNGGNLTVTANRKYDFSDVYTDVFSINNLLDQLTEPQTIILVGLVLGINVTGINSMIDLFAHIKKERNLADDKDPQDIGEWDLPGFQAFEITDTWSDTFEATIKK